MTEHVAIGFLPLTFALWLRLFDLSAKYEYLIKRKVKRPHQRLYLSVRSFLVLVLLEMDVSIKTFYYSGGTL